jgi:tryptophan synthase alpha chain
MTLERIERTFKNLAAEKKTALVVYLCIGDPSVDDSKACALAAIEAGADILELGVPFSDPTADGHVIAAAAYRAIHNGGSLRAALEVTKVVRQKYQTPVVLFTYYNPIIAFGEERLPAALREAGGDALLVVDLPPEEGAALRAQVKASELAFIPLLAPTSDDARERAAFATGSGFVYYVSVTGVTGVASIPLREATARANSLRDRSGLPVVIGFGIDSGEKARAAAEHGAAGVVVGTAVVKAIAAGTTTEGRVAAVKKLVGELRRALDA